MIQTKRTLPEQAAKVEKTASEAEKQKLASMQLKIPQNLLQLEYAELSSQIHKLQQKGAVAV